MNLQRVAQEKGRPGGACPSVLHKATTEGRGGPFHHPHPAAATIRPIERQRLTRKD